MSSSTEHPFLSIIMPALNEERRLPGSLVKVDEFLKKQSYTAELVIVENGSTDATVQVVQDFAKTHPYVRLYAGEPRGKGRAVRRGMLAARGDYRFMCDVDLSMPIDEITKFLPPTLNGVDVAIAVDDRGRRRAKSRESGFHDAGFATGRTISRRFVGALPAQLRGQVRQSARAQLQGRSPRAGP